MRGKFIGGRERGFCITPLHLVIFSTASQRELGEGSEDTPVRLFIFAASPPFE